MRAEIQQAKRIVIKVGSSTLCYENGHLNLERIEKIVRQISDLANQGKEMILVSSGAVGAGLAPLGFKERPRDIVLRQASAAVGQGVLLHMYERMFREYGHTVGQILLTRADSTSRHSYLNLRNTLNALLRLGVIPIINENDVVAIEEFKIGDNDTLSAIVAGIIEADLLLILSDIDGLYTSNPSTNPEATLIDEVLQITDETYAIAGGAGSSIGTGGMYTKIKAAHIATNSGVHMVIASGEKDDSIRLVAKGEVVGTHFKSLENAHNQKKHWVAFGKRLQGEIHVDDGCAKAILDKGSSILPAGVISVVGEFEPGETCSILHGNKEIARGMVNYSSHDIDLIKGHKTAEIANLLGIDAASINATYDEVIHRDNLVILR